MKPVISVVGHSNSGKTTFIENMIPVLKKRGYRVGTVKHTSCRFEIDYPGKDTWRMCQAGAELVAIASSEKLAVIRKLSEEKRLDEIINWLSPDVDLMLVEGYKNQPGPKIEVTGSGKLFCGKEDGLLAIIINGQQVTNQEFDPSIPHFNMKEMEKIGDWLEKNFLKLKP